VTERSSQIVRLTCRQSWKKSDMVWRNAHLILEPLMNAEGYYTWSFDPLFPVDVRFYTYNQRKDLRPNRHDYLELFYLYQGELAFQVHTQCFQMKAGDLAVIGSTFFHKPVVHGFSHAKGIVLCFLPKVILGQAPNGEDLEYLKPFLAQDEAFPHLVPARTGLPAKIFELIKLIRSELPAKSIRNRLNARTYLKMILVLLGNHYADYQIKLMTFYRKQENIKRLRPVLDFLDREFAKPVMVRDMASMAHMSQSGFKRFFRNVTGQGLVAYVNHLRIARAEWLLASSDIPLAELCQQVGFCDQSYFGVVFRKSVRMTPTQYRHKFSGASVPGPDSQKWPDASQTAFITHSDLTSEELIPKANSKRSGPMPTEAR
jgi:AraC-like DNA-binding protein